MAEGLLRCLAGGRFSVYSAGTHPVVLNPRAVEVMQELQIDISAQHSKSMGEFADQAFDSVITVCNRAKDSCPRWPHAGRLVHWSFEDSAVALGRAEEQRQAFRAVRDQIKARIEAFLSTGL